MPEIIEWETEMARVLIEERRRLQQSFSDRSRHDSLWTRIANYIRGIYQYEVTARQYQVKWYSLKRGYENLKRLMSDDPDADGVQVRSPIGMIEYFSKICQTNSGLTGVIT